MGYETRPVKGDFLAVSSVFVRQWRRKTQKVRHPRERAQKRTRRKEAVSPGNPGFSLIFILVHKLTRCVILGGRRTPCETVCRLVRIGVRMVHEAISG